VTAVSTSHSATEPVVSDANDTFGEVLAAAEACFLQFGVQRTRMEDVAQRAGIPRPYLYRYVSSKDDLILRVMVTHTARLDEKRRNEIPLKGSVVPILVRSIEMGVEWMRADPFTHDVMSINGGELGVRIATAVQEQRVLPAPAYWLPIFEYGLKRGELRDDIPVPQMLLWVGSMEYLFLQRPEFFRDYDQSWYIEQLAVRALCTDKHPKPSGRARTSAR
jgi:AcrR family transcriptional regulator